MNKHYPYKAEIMDPESKNPIWWPVSSHQEDDMVIGDGIPGDQKSAELCARCCNIAYGQALDDVRALFLEKGMDFSRALQTLRTQ